MSCFSEYKAFRARKFTQPFQKKKVIYTLKFLVFLCLHFGFSFIEFGMFGPNIKHLLAKGFYAFDQGTEKEHEGDSISRKIGGKQWDLRCRQQTILWTEALASYRQAISEFRSVLGHSDISQAERSLAKEKLIEILDIAENVQHKLRCVIRPADSRPLYEIDGMVPIGMPVFDLGHDAKLKSGEIGRTSLCLLPDATYELDVRNLERGIASSTMVTVKASLKGERTPPFAVQLPPLCAAMWRFSTPSPPPGAPPPRLSLSICTDAILTKTRVSASVVRVARRGAEAAAALQAHFDATAPWELSTADPSDSASGPPSSRPAPISTADMDPLQRAVASPAAFRDSHKAPPPAYPAGGADRGVPPPQSGGGVGGDLRTRVTAAVAAAPPPAVDESDEVSLEMLAAMLPPAPSHAIAPPPEYLRQPRPPSGAGGAAAHDAGVSPARTTSSIPMDGVSPARATSSIPMDPSWAAMRAHAHVVDDALGRPLDESATDAIAAAELASLMPGGGAAGAATGAAADAESLVAAAMDDAAARIEVGDAEAEEMLLALMESGDYRGHDLGHGPAAAALRAVDVGDMGGASTRPRGGGGGPGVPGSGTLVAPLRSVGGLDDDDEVADMFAALSCGSANDGGADSTAVAGVSGTAVTIAPPCAPPAVPHGEGAASMAGAADAAHDEGIVDQPVAGEAITNQAATVAAKVVGDGAVAYDVDCDAPRLEAHQAEGVPAALSRSGAGTAGGDDRAEGASAPAAHGACAPAGAAGDEAASYAGAVGGGHPIAALVSPEAPRGAALPLDAETPRHGHDGHLDSIIRDYHGR